MVGQKEDTMTTTRGLLALALGAAAIFGGATLARAKGDGGKFVQMPSGELKWEEFYPGGPLESFVVGSKEAKHGPTGFFIKFKPGFDSGWHVHESEYTGVILSGTIIETNKGPEGPKPLGAGSYYSQPKTVHRTQCTAAAECLVWIFEAGRFSFTPTTEDGKPLPKQAPPAAAKAEK
jgi:quercetin dioxygenase-like cupin family protein